MKRISQYYKSKRGKYRIRLTLLVLFIAVFSFELGSYVNEYNRGSCVYEKF